MVDKTKNVTVGELLEFICKRNFDLNDEIIIESSKWSKAKKVNDIGRSVSSKEGTKLILEL